MTGADGYWQILDNQVSITNRKVQIACNGWWGGDDDRHLVTGQLIKKYPTSNSFNYSTPYSTWEYVNMTWSHSVGVGMKCTIVRGQEDWDFYFENAFGNLPSLT